MTMNIFHDTDMFGKKKECNQTNHYMEASQSLLGSSRDWVWISRISLTSLIRALEKEEPTGCVWDRRKIKGSAFRKMEPIRVRWQRRSTEKGVKRKVREIGDMEGLRQRMDTNGRAEERDWTTEQLKICKKINLMGSKDSILLSTENSCKACSLFQIYLLWMKIYGSFFIKLTKKSQKSNLPLNVQIYMPYLVWDIWEFTAKGKSKCKYLNGKVRQDDVVPVKVGLWHFESKTIGTLEQMLLFMNKSICRQQ